MPIRATPTVHGLVVRGTAIESVAKHYCRSYGIPFTDAQPLSVGRVKAVPKQGYVRVEKGRGSFIAVILPHCLCTEEELHPGCVEHYFKIQ